MADQIQTLKLEISKNAALLPYERISFHKILGILKTENGMQVLLKDLSSAPLIRESAVLTLKEFKHDEVQKAFLELLKKKISATERIYIFDNFSMYGTPEVVESAVEYIEKNKTNEDSLPVLAKAFNVIKTLGESKIEIRDYLKLTALDKERSNNLRALAIIALSAFKDIVTPNQKDNKSFIEEILKDDSEEIICAAYNSMSLLNEKIRAKINQNKSEEEELFTYSPENEDRAVLDIKVLLGKMTSKFDLYSVNSKIAILNAMISCNHRELLMHIMKALTSNDPELMDMTLDLLLANTDKLHDPDKLFRNLISLSIDSPRGNELVINIFERYFNNLKETRRNVVFKDKLYNYIVVTLETYFETYRKKFMVAEVIERNFPENFQKIRHFILNKFTPVHKKKIINSLKLNDPAIVKTIMTETADLIPYVDESEKDDLACFLEMIYETDIKSREISATRIDDINFEKRYLRDRIIRICAIIGKLKIDASASPLVIIYNYVKKYTDKDILDAVSYTLSMLNYSYMLGELEILLSAGDEIEEQKALRYLSLFSDQRSLNIILDYLKQNKNKESDIIIKLLETLLKQDLFGNITANSILKEIIENNANPEIKKLSILCISKCGREVDIAFLDGQFNIVKDNQTKEAIVQAIEHIINTAIDINKRAVRNMLLEYIKDPGIMVRIHACYLLIKLGHKNVFKTIMDMMTIKNKKIQRDIISIFGNLKSVEFAYFLISLIKEEYAISSDIIAILSLLPIEELKEIDHFIINIFKKHEFLGAKESGQLGIEVKQSAVSGLSEGTNFMLTIEINNFLEKIKSMNIIETKVFYQQINNLVLSEISKTNGTLSMTANGKILAYYKDPLTASKTALSIHENFKRFNNSRLAADRYNIYMQLLSENIKIINEEIINFDDTRMRYLNMLPIYNRVIINRETRTLIEKEFFSQPIPDLNYKRCTINETYDEIIGPVNFLSLSKILLDDLSKQLSDKQKKDIKLETELRQKQTQKSKSPVAIAYAQALDDLGRALKDDLNDINKYVQKRTTDRELILSVEKMLSNIYKRYFVEKSKIFSEIE